MITIKEKKEIIRDAVVEFYGISFYTIRNSSRQRSIVKARAAYCFLMREILNSSMSTIGENINKDHTSVLYLAKRFKEEWSSDGFGDWFYKKYPELKVVDRVGKK